MKWDIPSNDLSVMGWAGAIAAVLLLAALVYFAWRYLRYL